MWECASQLTKRFGTTQIRWAYTNVDIENTMISAKNWNDAQADCKRDNGNLVSVTSVRESAFVHILNNGSGQYWIGLSDTQV